MTAAITVILLTAGILLGTLRGRALSATAREIDVSVDVALEKFVREVKGAREFLKAARGVLVFPKVYKAGFIVGGEYGEGALRVKGRTVEYYSVAAGSVGFQFGAQVKTLIIIFMEQGELDRFRRSDGWEAGVDGSIAILDVGAGGTIDTATVKSPIVAFVIGQKGLMVDVSLKGAKFTKIKR
ncbi:MAG: hypothetical protein D6713_02980 [Deltaproteobacteria bacterium]|nr:MAG: hypothetical protein D6713_02980 [Deltaproteobacteria bacterium]